MESEVGEGGEGQGMEEEGDGKGRRRGCTMTPAKGQGGHCHDPQHALEFARLTSHGLGPDLPSLHVHKTGAERE